MWNEIIKYGGQLVTRGEAYKDALEATGSRAAAERFAFQPAVYEGRAIVQGRATTSFERYMIRSRGEMVRDLYKYDREVAKMFSDLADQVLKDLEKAATRGGREHIRAVSQLLRSTSRDMLSGYKSTMKEGLTSAAETQARNWGIGMKPYGQVLERAGVEYDVKGIVHKIPVDAVRAIYARTYTDGLHLSNRIWNVTAKTQQGLSRLVTEGVARGLHYDDPRMAAQVQRFLQPIRQGRKVSPTITRKLKDGTEFTFRQRPVSFDAARLLRTEYGNAYREAEHRSALLNPACEGELWSLSAEHPDLGCDCEDYATHDEGLGEGVFAVGNAPIAPHPDCICDQSQVLIPIDKFMDYTEDFVKYNTGPLAQWFEGQIKGTVRV